MSNGGWDDKPTVRVDATEYAELLSRLATLTAENERMRKALEMIAGKESGMGVHRACCAKGKSIADTALAGERGKA